MILVRDDAKRRGLPVLCQCLLITRARCTCSFSTESVSLICERFDRCYDAVSPIFPANNEETLF